MDRIYFHDTYKYNNLCLLCSNAEMEYLEEVVSVRALPSAQAVMDGLDRGHAQLWANKVVASPPHMRFNLGRVVHDFITRVYIFHFAHFSSSSFIPLF